MLHNDHTTIFTHDTFVLLLVIEAPGAKYSGALHVFSQGCLAVYMTSLSVLFREIMCLRLPTLTIIFIYNNHGAKKFNHVIMSKS